MSRLLRPLLPLALVLLCAPVTAAFTPAQISVQAEGEGLIRLEASGIWPDTCTPQLLETLVQAHDIVLSATREEAGCSPIPSPYALATGPFDPAVLAPDGGIQRIRVLVDGANGGAPILAGCTLMALDGMGNQAAMETGFWWAEQGGEFGAGPGLGLSVESQAGLVSLSVMGYDAHGAATWHFGAGELAHGSARFDLGRFDGGAGPFAQYAAPAAMRFSGTVDLEVLTPARAILWFSRLRSEHEGLELRPLSIVRFHFAQEPGEALLGRWLIASEEPRARATRWFEWIESRVSEHGFVLLDATGNARLECETPAGRPSSPPIICRLDDGDADRIEFTDVGLRRLSGWDAQARHTLAIRLD